MMNKQLIRVGSIQRRYTSTGRFSSYSIECSHDGLNEHRELKSSDIDVLQNKVDTLLARWAEKWEKVEARNEKERSANSAADATRDAQEILNECERLLAQTLSVDDRVNWETLKCHKPFKWEASRRIPHLRYSDKTGEPISIIEAAKPRKPSIGDPNIAPIITFFDKIFKSSKRKKESEAEQKLLNATKLYDLKLKNALMVDAESNQLLVEQTAAYSSEKATFDSKQAVANAEVDKLRDTWIRHDSSAVIEHAELVLSSSKYPDWYKCDFDVSYQPEPQVLIVEYDLPAPDAIPTLEKVTYVKSRDELTEKHLIPAKAAKLFDQICYQVALWTIHEQFEADEPNAIASIVFNGWVEAINPSRGVLSRGCILSLHVSKEEFLKLDLANVEPRACFKALKGVAAASLAQVVPVRPLLQMDHNDPRFVDSYAVADQLDESVNLAAMDWEDFEHLVRELFGKIFTGDGAEVRVTQASRDGGVDAVAFDPDPIRGGKIVIQAKRYTATVGVSAVRDLYGTIMNEGAIKGILVTTSDFGPDAHSFAADKPITLLNGSNLLSLLADHGHRAKIDINEARRLRDQ